MITSLTALSMLTNLCLVLLLLFADPFVPKFYFQLTEKKLYVLFCERARCFNRQQHALYSNFGITTRMITDRTPLSPIAIINNGNRTEWSPILSVIIRVINKIRRPRSGSPICQSRVWLQTELDDTKSCNQLIITITISEKKILDKHLQ